MNTRTHAAGAHKVGELRKAEKKRSEEGRRRTVWGLYKATLRVHANIATTHTDISPLSTSY